MSTTFDPNRHHRRSIRLRGYDYAQAGAYFITIVTHARECLFGEIANGEMQWNEFGALVQFTWDDLVNHIADIELDAFVVMPNHIHGIVVIADSVDGANVGAGSEPAPTNEPAPTTPPRKHQSLSEIVRQFKTFSARRINDKRDTRGISVWQRNYYEHIIRNECELERIRAYIENNPAQWTQDAENPQRRV